MGKIISCVLRNKQFKDINPVDFGAQQCAPCYKFGPYIRQYYLMHYVLSGKGVYIRGDKTYNLSKGEFFLIYPDEVTTYMADKNEPWEYIWVGITGELAKRFNELESPVGRLPETVFRELRSMLNDDFSGWDNMKEEYIVTAVHRIMAQLFARPSNNRHYTSRVKAFINTSYMKDISVQEIADELSVDRRYLSRLFKEKSGVGIKDYLISVRLENAARFLSSGYSVNEACELCGYSDRSNFSRMFRKKYGVWPSEYLQKN
ncbi:MAG: AraC family transcriptional regulator [Clostridia bacterium]|nr:AraC family transcriptional regulator [Clostridia bacterium]